MPTDLNAYMAWAGDREAGAVLVFHHRARDAKLLAWPVLKSWFDDCLFFDVRVNRLPEREDIMRQARSVDPHVIDDPETCPTCEMWGGEPRFGDQLCEFCEDSVS